MGPSNRHVSWSYYDHVPVTFGITFGDDVDDIPMTFAITVGVDFGHFLMTLPSSEVVVGGGGLCPPQSLDNFLRRFLVSVS